MGDDCFFHARLLFTAFEFNFPECDMDYKSHWRDGSVVWFSIFNCEQKTVQALAHYIHRVFGENISISILFLLHVCWGITTTFNKHDIGERYRLAIPVCCYTLLCF